MASSKVVREWLNLADEDFGFASVNLDDLETQYFGLICFHFQQAAEKYFKAYIVAKNLKFEKIHDLDSLRQLCLASNSDFSELEDECLFLNDFYVEARYPMVVPSPKTRDIANKAKESAQSIRDLVQKKLI